MDANATVCMDSLSFLSLTEASASTSSAVVPSTMKLKAQALFEQFDIEAMELEEMVLAIDYMAKQEKQERDLKDSAVSAEIQEEDERLAKLQEENESLKKDLEAVDARLETLRKKKGPVYLKKKSEFEKSEAKIGLLQRKCDKREKMNQGIQAFLETHGISIGRPNSESSEGGMSIIFSRIHPLQDRPFVLYFSLLSQKFEKFCVERAEPDFAEFEELAEKSNLDQDISKLFCLARKYWLKKISK